MKYIKRNKLIKEDNEEVIEVDKTDSDSMSKLKERLNDLKDEVNEFNMKKSKLEKIVMDNREGKDISKVIEDIINGNKFLTMYYPVVKKMLNADLLKERIDYYKKLLVERGGDLESSKNLSDPEERQEQEDKINAQIDSIKEKGKDMEEKLKEMEKKVDEEQKDLEKYIDNMKDKFEDDLKKFKVDVEPRKEL